MRLAYLALAFLLILTVPADAPSCGPFFESAGSVPVNSPAVPRPDFEAGKLGVVQGSHYLEYLIVAYRHLEGKSIQFGPEPLSSQDAPVYARTARFSEYLNCSSHALETARRTLAARTKQFGAQHRGIKEWIAAQERVLSSCNGEAQTPDAPGPNRRPY